MAELPLLTAIALALPSKHQAIDHIPHLINHFLVPPTIDAAVYLDLQLVSKVFGDCRPLTVGAMDGAAALGRLDILDRLDASRSEGCSAAAFNGAAANNHFKVLKWLLRRHSHHCNFTEALASAAGAGHLRVVKVLTKAENAGYSVWGYEAVMEAAVLNGQVETLKYHMNFERISHYRRLLGVLAVNVAAKNGLTEVMRAPLWIVEKPVVISSQGLQCAAAAGHADIVALLLEHDSFSEASAAISMEIAAEAGHVKVVFMLLPSCGEFGVVRALAAAVTNDHSTLAEFLVRFCSPSQVASAVETANSDQRELLEQLRAKYPFKCRNYPVDKSDYTRFVSAAACGNEQVVKALMRRFFCESTVLIGYVVEVAAVLSQYGVVKIILDEFTSSPSIPDFGIRPVLKQALKSNDLDMARLLTKYCDRYTAGIILNKCGLRYQVEAVKALAERSYPYDIAAAALEACLANHEDVFSALLKFMQETTAREVSDKLMNAGKLGAAKNGLANKCNPEKLFAEAVAKGTTEVVKLLLGEMSGPAIGLQRCINFHCN